MKDYKSYMDRVEVSDTLHARLTALESEKRPAPRPVWKKYGTLAAALVLVVGLAGYFGLTYGWDGGVLAKIGGEDGPTVSMNAAARDPQPSIEAIMEVGGTNGAADIMDIAPEGDMPPVPRPDGTQTMGGYEVRGELVAQYFALPYIAYGEVDYESSVDWCPPVGVMRRDVNEKEMLALWKYGEQVLTQHLDWGGYTVTAHAMVNRDGSLWCLWVHGSAGETGLEHFTLTAMPGGYVPSCIVYPESKVNNVWGTEVSASGYDGELASTRRISFMKDDIGYSFEITGKDTDAIAERVSRLARWIIIEGLDLSPFGIVKEPVMVGDTPVSIPNANGDGYSTPAYDPTEPQPTPTPVLPTRDPAAQSSTAPSMAPRAVN